MVVIEGPELVIGLVGAVGSPLGVAAREIAASLSRFEYETTHVRLSSLLKRVPSLKAMIDNASEKTRLRTAMEAGTRLRSVARRGDALVAFASAEMRTLRREAENASAADVPAPIPNRCFVLRSLKHPDEVFRLRQLYRDQFILVGVYSPREQRVRDLSERLADDSVFHQESMRAEAEALIAIDEKEQGTAFGQNVRDTFPLADAFVSTANLARDVHRALDLFFGHPFTTPTRDEHGIFHAQAAALRSAALARQVGACVTNENGDILAVGCNEVPRAGGGQYWADDRVDGRDFALGHDRNDRLKQRVIRDVVARVHASEWIRPEIKSQSVDELIEAVSVATDSSGAPRLRESLLSSLTEFGRDVHAEMSALMTLARLHNSSERTTLYCTTFPCHNCAKHMLAAGVARVVYIEPYAKSFAAEFHPEALAVESERVCEDGRVRCDPFSGIAPRRYLELFRSGRRKDRLGTAVAWQERKALPWFASPESGGYDQADLASESTFVTEILALLKPLMDTEQKAGDK